LLDSTLDELIDDAKAWSAVRTTMRQHLPELASHLEGSTGRPGSGDMTLRQTLSLLPHTDEVQAALEAALTALGH
jgi:hypothetical protein